MVEYVVEPKSRKQLRSLASILMTFCMESMYNLRRKYI